MKIVGIGVCGNGEADRYMEKTMKEFQRLCDDVLIVCNNASTKEINLIKDYGFKYYIDDREWGKQQPNIKTDLLKNVSDLNPDWIVALDMDEVFAPEVTREKLEELALSGEHAWKFMVVNLYNDEQHFAHESGIQRFWNVRFYKYMPDLGLQFLRKALHCGLGPPYAYQLAWHAPYYLLHYGLMKEEDRQRKVERYKKYDPNARFKDKRYYDDLGKKLRMREWKPDNMLKYLSEMPECQKRTPPKVK